MPDASPERLAEIRAEITRASAVDPDYEREEYDDTGRFTRLVQVDSDRG